MRFVLTALVFFLTLLNLKAHEVNQAHFVLKKIDQHWMIEGDFPWTLRNSLIQFDPTVEHAKNQISIDTSLFYYVQSHLILKTITGDLIPLTEIIQKSNPDHSHQILYEFHFEQGDLAEITNTLMININEDHVNYLVFRDGDEEKNYKTSKNNTQIRLEQENHFPIPSFWFWAILISLLGLGIFILKKKKG